MADNVLDNVFEYLVNVNQNGDPLTVSQDLRDSEDPFIFVSKPDSDSGRRRVAKIRIGMPSAGQDNRYAVNFDIETHEKVSANPVALTCLFGKDYAVSDVVPIDGKISEYHIYGSFGTYVDTNTADFAKIQEQIITLFELAESMHKSSEEYGL